MKSIQTNNTNEYTTTGFEDFSCINDSKKKSPKANLALAKKNKNDEFYTQYEDIENELNHYGEHFKDKVVLLNCDDAEWSNFWNYFSRKFDILGLKKLIGVHYSGVGSPTYKILTPGLGGQKIDKITMTGNGDFRNEEGIELLKEADIVVTNPPFSLFREFVKQLIDYDKKFLIIGNQNAISYKEIFSLIKDNKIWLGVSMDGSGKYFRVNDDYILTEKSGKIVDNTKYARVNGVVWFTNLPNKKRNEEIILWKKYEESEYPKYDNYDAINVDKVKHIPKDYFGVIGVPISFMDKFNPNQFEIIGIMATTKITDNNFGYPYINGKKKYARILIKRKR